MTIYDVIKHDIRDLQSVPIPVGQKQARQTIENVIDDLEACLNAMEEELRKQQERQEQEALAQASSEPASEIPEEDHQEAKEDGRE